VIVNGSIVAMGTPAELSARTNVTSIAFRLPDADAIAALPPVADGARISGRAVEIRTSTPTADLHHLTAWAIEQELELADLSVRRPNLEDIYLSLTDPSSAAGTVWT
jgi:ABC-2 type transport system ATP-binding protein